MPLKPKGRTKGQTKTKKTKGQTKPKVEHKEPKVEHKETKAYGGVLPWSIDPKGSKWILLGRESDGPEQGKWSDFGGGVEPKDSSVLRAAFREMEEESMGLLSPPDLSKVICPSLTFELGAWKGTLVLGKLGVGSHKDQRLTKDHWNHLASIPKRLEARYRDRPCKASTKTTPTGTKAHDPRCEKDKALWVRLKDIRQVEPSLLLVKGKTLGERVIPLRKNYGLLLTKALEMID